MLAKKRGKQMFVISINRNLVGSSVRAAALLGVSASALACSTSAWAACTPASPGSNTTVTCTGTGLPAFIAATGVTGLTVNIGSGASITGVTQTVSGTNGQYSSVQVNGSSTVTNAGTITPTLAASQARDYVGVSVNGSGSTLINNGSISITNPGTLAGSSAYRLYGVISSSSGSDFSNVVVSNYGSISLTQTGASNGISRGIYARENIASMTINNYGTVSVSRVASSTNALAAIDADDDTNQLTVNNFAGATLSTTGASSYTVGGRAGIYTVVNAGTITNSGGQAAILIYGSGSTSDNTSSVDNTKTGVINGAVMFADANPITGGNVPVMPRDSTLTNEGTINGSVYFYGHGTNVFDNSGSLNGNLVVNESLYAATGSKTPSFTFTNEGTLTGNINITDIAGSANTVKLTGTGFSGQVTATGTGNNSLTLNGVTRLASVSGFSDLNLTTSNVTVTSGVALVPNQNKSTIETTIYGPGGTLSAPSTNLGSINGTLTLGAATTITPTFASIVRNGDVYRLASSVTGNTTGISVANNSALVTLSPAASSGSLLLNASVRNASTISGISSNGAAALNSLLAYNGRVGSVVAIGTSIENMTSLDAVRQAAQQLAPQVNGASTQVPIDLTTAFQSQIGTRLDSLFYGGLAGQQGRSADYNPPRAPVIVQPLSGAWGNGVGNFAEQSAGNGVSGYNARGGGAIVGYDRLLTNQFRLGGAFGYASDDVNDTSFGRRQSIRLYQGLVYGAFTQANWYVNGAFGVAGLDYDSSRSVTFAGFNDLAKATHGGMLFSGRGESGYAFETALGTLVPLGSFSYVHVDQNGYTETSTAGAGLAIAHQQFDSARSGLGAKAVVPLMVNPNVAFAFEGRAVWQHEFADTRESVTSSFLGADASFVSTGPTVSRDMADVGAAFRFSRPRDGASFSVGYNAIIRSHYVDHVAMLKARIDF